MPRSWKCRAIPLLAVWVSVACYRENLYLHLYLYKITKFFEICRSSSDKILFLKLATISIWILNFVLCGFWFNFVKCIPDYIFFCSWYANYFWCFRRIIDTLRITNKGKYVNTLENFYVYTLSSHSQQLNDGPHVTEMQVFFRQIHSLIQKNESVGEPHPKRPAEQHEDR